MIPAARPLPRLLAGFAALTLALSACSTGLRPVTGIGAANGGPSSDYGAPLEGSGTEWADAALARPGAGADPLSAEEVRGALDAAFAARFDMDVLSYAADDAVARYVNLFSGPARASFVERLRRGTRYEPLIRGRLAAAGLPEDLFYLALVESGFEPHAYSRAAAVGLWQFMTTTAKAVGLRVDWWIDERRDPVRATDAAVRHLRGLRSQFDGSLYLAAAAYNGGSGRVSRGLAQHTAALDGVTGDDRFFALAETGALRDETRFYVPQIIAAALVAKSPAVYGIVGEALPPFAYDSVLADGGTPLAAVAEASGSTVGELHDLNGHILRGAVPPGDAMHVRVPPGRGEGAAARLAALPAERRRGFEEVTTAEHGRLSAIAARHGLAEAQLAAYNPGVRRNRRGLLVGGQRVLVPAPAVIAAALAVPDPAIERYGTSPAAPAARAAAAAAPAPRAPRAPRTVTVAAGDVLGRIAERHDLTVAELRRLNGLESDVIRPGQVLVVEAAAARAKKAAARKPPAKRASGKRAR